MSEQLQLVDETATPRAPRKLTANQQLAWDFIRARDGVTCDEIGAWVHAHRERRPHGVDDRCDWCARTGRQLVTSKALKPLLTYRRNPGGHLYLPRNPADRNAPTPGEGEQVSHDVDDDPFAGL